MRTPNLAAARRRLREAANPSKAEGMRAFFKNCAADTFLGIAIPEVRRVAREFRQLALEEVAGLMHSPVHEERSLAHAILRLQFEKAEPREQTRIYRFYLANRSAIRDWDGVDDSAPYIVGRYLAARGKAVLYRMIRARNLWDRRIALVSTWWFIRGGNVDDTLALCAAVLQDPEDLIHKAAGWMLREVGKRDDAALRRFLDAHAAVMPRTMLRYSIERFPEPERRHYLAARRSAS